MEYKALIVDDQSLNVKLIEKLLLDYQNFEITAANSASEALFYYFQQKWDIVFLDIMMPVLDGTTFLTILDELVKAHKIPFQKNIIVCTSLSDIDKLQAICQCKLVKGLLRKPVSKAKFHELVEDILAIPST